MSKLIIYDFECPEHGVFEDMVQPLTPTAPCPKCQVPGLRMISPPRIDKYNMALSDSASPESISYFEKIHRQRKKIEDKSFADHGDYGSHPGSDGGKPLTPAAAGKL